MDIYIASLMGVKEGCRPEVWTFLFLAENYNDARKAALIAANARFPRISGYRYINIIAAKQDPVEVEEMLRQVAPAKDWQEAIGYKDGKPLKN